MKRGASSHVMLVLVSVSLAIACAFTTACGSSPPNLVTPPVVTVQTTKAKLQTISDVIIAAGSFYPLHQASLSPKISAPVRTFYVNRGDRVHRGQLLATLENKDLVAAAAAAEGAFDQARANYATATATTLPEQLQTDELNVQNAQANLEAQQKLYDSNLQLYREHAGARKQVDQAAVALTAARSQYLTAKKHLENLRATGTAEQKHAAEGQLESARGQYLAAKAQLNYSELRSPIDGVVADRSVYPGEMAIAGTPLIVVMGVSKVIVRLHVTQPDAALLKLGDKATIRVPGLKNEVPGKVTVFSPALDPNSTTVEIWVEASNPNHDLQPGTSVEVSIVAKVMPDALVVPAHSILTAPDGTTSVMVVGSDSRAHHRKITTGIENNGEIQILSGLKPGEEIVATGAYGLPDNTKVKTEPVSSSGPTAASEGQS